MSSLEQPLTLQGLNSMVRAAISEAMPSRYWVVGELSEVRETAVGHCYIELVQRDEATGELVAKARGNIWSRIYSLLRPHFLEETGQPFAAGLKVLLQVTVNFHELYGYALDVCNIDPTYTVGDMARRRQLIIKQLTDEGVIGLNKELPFPLLPQRVAVISSASAAGYGDFCDQLLGNKYGFVFYPHLFSSPMQGSGVEQGIIDALDRIAQDVDMWDVVVIIRGGGATSELSCFDTYDLANNCAQFPLPIITGIGHQRDESVLDMVAHTRAKTPTAAAELLIHAMLGQDAVIEEMMQGVLSAVCSRIDNEKQRMQSLRNRLSLGSALFVQEKKAWMLTHMQSLRTSAVMYVKEHKHRLDLVQGAIDAASPERILSLGYSITRLNGKAVRSIGDVVPGDKVTTTVAGGEITSIVNGKKEEKKL
ncbi:MAG: exodeoxyribonuclease VII large subunit [Bacteroidaceae bacterium]|nr:exodeoxyribonuclease VII large subunit [Bacteroidaceae bacterium]